MSINREKFKIKEKREINLKIEVEDFGPITDGKITLKPFTLFIGPNNSGKSYAATLIHSIFESYTPTTLPKRIPFFIRRRLFSQEIDIRPIRKEFQELKEQINKLKEEKKIEIPKQLVKKAVNIIFKEIYEKRLSDELIRSFACTLKDLIRIGKDSFGLKINSNSDSVYLRYQEGRLEIGKYPQLDLDIKIETRVIKSPSHRIKIDREEDNFLITIGGILLENKEEKEFGFNYLMDIILEICTNKILEKVAIPCYYLPAARSGILQGHKALAASLVRNVPYIGIERLEIPKFSGVVSDFISSVITLPEEKGTFYQLAQDFEKELIKGEIVVRTLDEYLYPDALLQRYR